MIQIQQLSLAVGGFELREVSFTVEDGRYAVLMGRTGVGKTTLMEAICGLRPIRGGQVILSNRDVTNLPPAVREIGYVPQDAALFPHLNVRQHLAFALAIRRTPDEVVQNRVAEVADWLDLSRFLDREVQGLSGGERQRVAVGRALAHPPRVLCLDEPLSALDEDTRDSMCRVLESVQKRTGITVLHITHSRWETERLAETVLELKNGTITPVHTIGPSPTRTSA